MKMLGSEAGEQKDNQSIDTVFKKLISDIKSNALKLPNQNERQVVAAWVIKLCESGKSGNSAISETEKKNHNLYAEILLKMLQRSNLKKPFSDSPNPGKLPTIPVYMSSYLDETDTSCIDDIHDPSWLLSNLEDSMLLHSFGEDKKISKKRLDIPTPTDTTCATYPAKKEDDFFQIPEANELEFYLSCHDKNIADSEHDTIGMDETSRKRTLIPREMEEIDDVTLDDDSLLQKIDDIAKQHVCNSPCRENPTKEKVLEKKFECLEARIEAESTKIQQQQDTMVKKILERKNSEMNDIKLLHQKKMADLEATLHTREQTISTLNSKLSDMQKHHRDEVGKLNAILEEKESMSKNAKTGESKLKAIINSKDEEMKNLKRDHFENVEKLVAENEANIAKVKDALAERNKALVAENESCKEDITKLTEKLKLTEETMNDVSKEKDACFAKQEEYQVCIKTLQSGLSEADGEAKLLEKEKSRLSGENQRLEKHVDELKSEASKTNTNVIDLQTQIEEYKYTIESLEANRKSDMKEAKIKSKEKLLEVETATNKKIHVLQKDFDLKESRYKSALENSTSEINKREKEVRRSKDQLKKQSIETKNIVTLLSTQTVGDVAKMFENFDAKLLRFQSSLTTVEERISLQKVNIVKRFEAQRKSYEEKLFRCKCEMDAMLSKFEDNYNLEVTQHNEKLARQKLEHEHELKGLLPLRVKMELEDTINSMQQQIALLQSQVDLLQDELDIVSSLNLSVKNTA